MIEYIKSKRYIIIFLTIIIVAIGSRIFIWPNAISEVNCDEIMTAVNAKSIADTGKDTYGTSFPVYLEAWGTMGQSVMLLYIMAFFIKIFGLSIVTVRLPMLVISIISLFVFYDFIRRVFKNEKLALVALAILSICPWHILQSIWSIDCNMFPHFLLISIYLMYIGITDKKWLLYISMGFFAITMYTYGVAIFVIPIFLLICGIYLLIKKIVNIKELIICMIIYLVVSSPLLAMYFLNAFHIEKDICIGPITIQYFANNTRTSDIVFFSDNILKTLLSNLKSLYKTVIIQYDGLAWNSTRIFGTTYHISLIFLIIAIVKIIKDRKNNNIGLFFIELWLIISLFLGLIINDTNINRLNLIWYPMLCLIVYGIYISYCLIEKKKIFRNIIITIYVILAIVFNVYLYGFYTNVIDMSGCFSRKYMDAIKYAISLNKENISYSNINNDGTIDLYIKLESIINSKEIKHIENEKNINNIIYNIKENQVYILKKSDIKKINIDNLKIKEFAEYMVVYL